MEKRKEKIRAGLLAFFGYKPKDWKPVDWDWGVKGNGVMVENHLRAFVFKKKEKY